MHYGKGYATTGIERVKAHAFCEENIHSASIKTDFVSWVYIFIAPNRANHIEEKKRQAEE